MNKLILAVLVSAICAGCDKETANETKKETNYTLIKNVCVCSFEFEGHKYITRYYGGIIHAASCKCNNGGKE